MIPPHAADTFALEKKTLMRQLKEMVAMPKDDISQKITTGLLLRRMSPTLKRMQRTTTDTSMNRRLVMNHAVQ